MLTEEIAKNVIKYLPLAIGWLLGIFSAVVIEQIKKQILKQNIKRGIKTELRELSLRLAASCFKSILDCGAISEEWAKWFKPYYKILTESDEYDYLRDKPKPDKKIDTYCDKEFYEYLVFMQNKNRANELKTPVYPKIVLPYLDSNYNTISLLNDQFVKLISKLKRETIHINSDYEQVWFYHTKTFERITDINHSIAVNNIEDICKRILRKEKNIISLIEKIIPL
ncbi:MAG: hypothetical protein M0Q21_02880 [Ignavibacteriaceae bacterium]|nr:hypothetical protein [Ignavibacteriaceae bacterium]